MSESEIKQAEQEQPAQDASWRRWFRKKEKEKKTFWQELLEWVVTIVAALAIALVVRTFLFELVQVDGCSMNDTLQDDEIMFVTKTEYTTMWLDIGDKEIFRIPIGGDPERFDVVICHYPGRGGTNFVKRVVGLPGDTVEIRDGYLYVNGVKYEEDYLTHRPNYSMSAYTVPENMFFVLGDNRSNSNDSHLIGPIPREMIVGHVRVVLWKAID